MMSTAKIAKFEIITCRGDHVDYVEVAVAVEDYDIDGGDLQYKYTGDALSAGCITNYICEGCHNNAYHVEFIEWVESDDYVSDYVI